MISNGSYSWSLEDVRRIFEYKQILETLDIIITEATTTGIKAEVTVSEKHARPDGIANGGLALVLIEAIGSISSCCAIDFDAYNSLGISVSCRHIRPAKIGTKLVAVSSPIHLGKTTHVWETKIMNEENKLVSTGQITMLIKSRDSQS